MRLGQKRKKDHKLQPNYFVTVTMQDFLYIKKKYFYHLPVRKREFETLSKMATCSLAGYVLELL